jgi:hypothetical protein
MPAEASQAAVSDINKRRIRITDLVPFVVSLAFGADNDIVGETTSAHIDLTFRMSSSGQVISSWQAF